jgi:hypothetical protein
MSGEVARPKKPKRPRPKYQVFISSTYTDLHEERREVTWEILKARHIPAGMENFTASDDRGWRTIQRTIDLSDYYVLLVAGMYGSIDPSTGMSWTEREYRYARDRGMRVLVFLRDDAHITADKIERTAEMRERVDALKRELRATHLCESWRTGDDLKTRVMQALQHQVEEDEDGDSPRPGWYRGDEIEASPTVLEEFARLSSENATLKLQLESLHDRTKEQLSLVECDGTAVADRLYEVPRLTVVGPPDQMFASLVTGPTRQDAAEHARTRALTIWLKFRINNTGTKPARNVVADFTATRVARTTIHRFPVSSPFAISRPVIKPFYLDPAEHVYVESHGAVDGIAKVRQRIKQVAAGGYEDLVAIGLEAQSLYTRPEDIPIELNYVLRSEDGETNSGSFVATVRIGDPVSLTISEAMGDSDQ